MGEARRRKLAGSPWHDPKQRAALLAMVHNGIAQDADPTLSGVTVIFPSGETVFLSAEDARRPPPAKGS
jgi:hypothetical protein